MSGLITAEGAIRFLHHEACRCRDHDDAEAFCLLLPALLRILGLEPMNYTEVEAFKNVFRQQLHGQAADGPAT